MSVAVVPHQKIGQMHAEVIQQQKCAEECVADEKRMVKEGLLWHDQPQHTAERSEKECAGYSV